MPAPSSLLKALCLLAGGLLLLAATVAFTGITLSSSLSQTARIGAYSTAALFVTLGAFLVSLALSLSWAKRIMAVGLMLLSIAILFLAFNPMLGPDRPQYVQIGAIALVVLLASRIILSVRVRQPRLDT